MLDWPGFIAVEEAEPSDTDLSPFVHNLMRALHLLANETLEAKYDKTVRKWMKDEQKMTDKEILYERMFPLIAS